MPQLVDSKSGETLIADLEVADRFWPRFFGLQFRASLNKESGLLLKPCSSVHTCFMRFAIDVIMLDQELCVIGFKQNVRPWRAVLCEKGTATVLETNAEAFSWNVGQRMEIV